MATFTRLDYRYLFTIGKKLYNGQITPKRAGAILMAMSEYSIGQQADWPNIHPSHRNLTQYRGQARQTDQTNVVNLTDRKDK